MLITSPRKNSNLSNYGNMWHRMYKTDKIYLGVFIDNYLKWGPHIQRIKNKLTKNIGILNKLRFYISVGTLKQLYYTLVFPYVNYALLSWATASQSQIQKNQNQAEQMYTIYFICSHKRECHSPLQTIRYTQTR